MGRTALLSVLVLGLTAMAALAQPPRQGMQIPDFATLDANKDGRVTREEFLAALPADQKSVGSRVFDARDANKDGVITADEMAPRR